MNKTKVKHKINSYFNHNPIPGTGPYVVSKVKPNEFVTFEKNPNYLGKKLTSIQVKSNPYRSWSCSKRGDEGS